MPGKYYLEAKIVLPSGITHTLIPKRQFWIVEQKESIVWITLLI